MFAEVDISTLLSPLERQSTTILCVESEARSTSKAVILSTSRSEMVLREVLSSVVS